MPSIKVGTASVKYAPRQPQAAAIGAAMSGTTQKVELPPTKWIPSARPRYSEGTDVEMTAADAGW